MDEAIVKQIYNELLASLEPLEAQSAALLQFLKDKGIATEEELAPYLEQAGNTSNVRWRAVQVRTAALISSALKPAEKAEAPPEPKKAEPISKWSSETGNRQTEKNSKEPTQNPERSEENKKEAAKPSDSHPDKPPQSEAPREDEAVEKKEAA